MKIGIMSDSHDNMSMIESAVSTFNKEKVDMVFHAGDIVSPFTATLFRDLRCKMACVWGNNDGDRLNLKKAFEGIGEFYGEFADIKIHDLRIGMLHGLHPAIISSVLNSNIFDIVIRGHNHKKEILKRDETLLINPGETCGYLTGLSTIMVVDLDTMQPEIIELENMI